MDAARSVIENGAVAVRGERIVAVGPRAELARRYQPRHTVDRGEAILTPGLINTHTHAAMSLLRGIANDVRLEDWLNNFIFPAEKKFVSREFVRQGTELACLEMMLSGTTTFTDMYYFEDEAALAAKSAGMRGVLGETVIRFPVADAATPADALRYAEGFIARFKNDPLIVPAVAPHALYTNADADLQASRALANKYHVPLLIHLSETQKENRDTQSARGMSPTRVLESLGVLDGITVAAHAIWVDAGDLAVLQRHHTGLAHCPSSNMMLASGTAQVTQWLRAGVDAGLGTDGPAGSNNDFDLMEEMDLAAKLQKLSTGDPTSLPARQAFAMATIGGARVLGMQKEIGSLEAGKRADLIAITLEHSTGVPLYDVYAQLVYALKGSDVRDVMVNGRWIVNDHRSLTLDQPLVLTRAREWGQRIQKGLAKH
ncbi:MAG TPA: amidohydrolase [Solibacterales bacterium]|nr:amidohydrolase [Bryobacterales bacterium]